MNAPPALSHLTPGHVVDGKYRIIRLIGEGGMGSVLEARHEVLGNHVALKFLHPEIAQQPGLEQRFIQEAKLSATMQNPHIVRVSDVDTTSEGAYLVMELLQGEPLQSLMDREGRLGMQRSVDFTLQILEGLLAAHQLGVVHRDLKPDNVFLTPTQQGPLLKLLDFGIAKLRAEEGYQMTLTRPGAIMGTPEYMAPEQAYSADLVDQRSDLYAVGIMLFEMLSGQRPAEGDTPQEIAEKAIKGQVLRLGDLCPHLPKPLIEAVHHAIAANPDERFPDAQAMRLSLLPFSSTALSAHDRESRLTGAATPFHAVNKTPKIEDGGMAPGSGYGAMANYSAEARMSTVPRTIPPADGPPPVTTQHRATAKTASMPEMAPKKVSPTQGGVVPMAGSGYPVAPPPTTAPQRRSGGYAWVWFLLVLLAGGGAFGGWYAYDVYFADTTPPPPQPTRRAPTATAETPTTPPDDFDDFEGDDNFNPTPRPAPRPRSPAPRPAPDPPPTLPTFQLPTNLPIPTTIPTTLPTSLPGLPFPAPAPTDSPKESAPAPKPTD